MAKEYRGCLPGSFRQTDGQTDRQTDRHIALCISPRVPVVCVLRVSSSYTAHQVNYVVVQQ